MLMLLGDTLKKIQNTTIKINYALINDMISREFVKTLDKLWTNKCKIIKLIFNVVDCKMNNFGIVLAFPASGIHATTSARCASDPMKKHSTGSFNISNKLF